MTNESSANAIIGNTLRIIASGEYHPGAELTQKMASYIIELEQKLTEMAVQLANAESKCRELAAENAVKHEFIKTCFRAAADGASMDGDDIQKLGERLGLFGREIYQPVLHGYICGHEAGEDTVYVMKKTPKTDAFLAEVRAQVWIEGSEPEEFGRYWVRYETDVGPQYCSAEWMEYNFCAGSNTNIHKIWLADHSRSINSLRGVTHYTKLPDSLEGAAQ
ncbi:hypothetical protein Q5738_09085 [Citrobacter werkmanii]|uniref:hypothetical protein n=1 Tax=Citrobacter werkmanii TaxID=67827 RepID=UPI00271A24B9|nr:hypothetical protein [Citrobacter werkmanii]MDO8233726.1 hypothetical protein [Citrobacter werkmanii]